MEKKLCEICGKEFWVKHYRIKLARYCSSHCYGQSLKNIPLPEITKKRMVKHHRKYQSSTTREKIGKANRVALTGRKLSPKHKEKILKNLNRKGFIGGEDAKQRMRLLFLGKPILLETRLKISEKLEGDKGGNWQGGKTKENILIRQGIEYRLWREAVFVRDNWTCQKCHNRGGTLQVHHINSFAEYPELRFVVSNGLTLCLNCHKLTGSYLKRKEVKCGINFLNG